MAGAWSVLAAFLLGLPSNFRLVHCNKFWGRNLNTKRLITQHTKLLFFVFVFLQLIELCFLVLCCRAAATMEKIKQAEKLSIFGLKAFRTHKEVRNEGRTYCV